MVNLPVRRDTAPSVIRAVVLRVRASAGPEQAVNDAPEAPRDDDQLATALARVTTTDDQKLLQQQQAFDRMTAQLAEQQREANVIRDMAMAQLKRDEETLKQFIAMI